MVIFMGKRGRRPFFIQLWFAYMLYFVHTSMHETLNRPRTCKHSIGISGICPIKHNQVIFINVNTTDKTRQVSNCLTCGIGSKNPIAISWAGLLLIFYMKWAAFRHICDRARVEYGRRPKTTPTLGAQRFDEHHKKWKKWFLSKKYKFFADGWNKGDFVRPRWPLSLPTPTNKHKRDH